MSNLEMDVDMDCELQVEHRPPASTYPHTHLDQYSLLTSNQFWRQFCQFVAAYHPLNLTHIQLTNYSSSLNRVSLSSLNLKLSNFPEEKFVEVTYPWLKV